jgi:hypothetical protein
VGDFDLNFRFSNYFVPPFLAGFFSGVVVVVVVVVGCGWGLEDAEQVGAVTAAARIRRGAHSVAGFSHRGVGISHFTS